MQLQKQQRFKHSKKIYEQFCAKKVKNLDKTEQFPKQLTSQI
jgi:hypothetical protein